MPKFSLLDIALPVLGGVTILTTYAFIIAKRQQKVILLGKKIDDPSQNYSKITDSSENLWWTLTITLAIITYFGMLIIIATKTRFFRIGDALFYGLIVLTIITLVGHRITRPRS